MRQLAKHAKGANNMMVMHYCMEGASKVCGRATVLIRFLTMPVGDLCVLRDIRLLVTNNLWSDELVRD